MLRKQLILSPYFEVIYRPLNIALQLEPMQVQAPEGRVIINAIQRAYNLNLNWLLN